jgi:RNA polymerase sigma-70 factor, ECF subfamily
MDAVTTAARISATPTRGAFVAKARGKFMMPAGPWPRAHAPGAQRGLRHLSDSELALAYLLHDDHRAFTALYERLLPYLTTVARRRVRSPEVAADLVQQAFLNAHLARDRFALGSQFRPWITRILVNLCVDHRRSRRRWTLEPLDPNALGSPPERGEHERHRERALARRALAALAPSQRRVVEMHWLEERPFPEVAEALSERLSTVKVRAHRAYKVLRRSLAAER